MREPITNELRIQMAREANWKCYYCGDDLGSKPTIDHKIPKSRGGPDERWNYAVCCFSCNASKRSKTEDEYFSALYEETWEGGVQLHVRAAACAYLPSYPDSSPITKEEYQFLNALAIRLFDKYPPRRPSMFNRYTQDGKLDIEAMRKFALGIFEDDPIIETETLTESVQ